MKKFISVLGVILTVVTGLSFATPANAATLPTPVGETSISAINGTTTSTLPKVLPDQLLRPMTGNYYYTCVLSSGYNYSMTAGEPLTNCKGSYLQKYLDGRQVAVFNLAYNGVVATAKPPSTGCILAWGLYGAGLVFTPPTGGASWFAGSMIAAVGIGYSCRA